MSRIPDFDGRVFERLRPRLVAISRRIVGSDADAEDVVQDCFIKWHGAAQGPVLEPAAWLTTVVRRQSIDILRARLREALAAQAAADAMPSVTPPLPEADLLMGAELAEALARLLALLSPAERMALVLHEVFECDDRGGARHEAGECASIPGAGAAAAAGGRDGAAGSAPPANSIAGRWCAASRLRSTAATCRR